MTPPGTQPSPHAPAYPAPTLTDCDREPIHIPGAIQPHGLLLALDADDRVVTASANSEEMLGRRPVDLLGVRLEDVIGATGAALVATSLQPDEMGAPQRLRMPPGDGTVAGLEADVFVHRSGDRVIVEVEPTAVPMASSAASYRTARVAIARLTETGTVSELCGRLAFEIRKVTGFDRVMVYRFDEEWNGEVVAEERREDLNPFLGLHYPATDIPAQARRLYTVNWTRLIADIGYTPVPLEPVFDPATKAPLDLSHSVLRSVSPIHVEYLSNMGVTASMSVSMVKDGQLWGLVACHHYSGPHHVAHDDRSAAEFLAQTASQLVDDRERADQHADELHASAVLSGLAARLAGDPRPVYDALFSDPALLELVDAQAAVLWVDGELTTVGDVPSAQVIRTIASMLTSPDGGASYSNNLAALIPEVVGTGVAGAMHLGNGPDRWLMWLRPELEQTIDWGGDPTNKAIAAAEGPGVRLSPRKSFEKWRQVVRGRSAAWLPWQVDAAERLRHHLSGELVRRSREHVAIAESLQRTLVLDEAPEFDGLDVLARYRPAQGSHLGGDWWDAFALADGRIVLAVGDVAGHGVLAATAMAQVRTALRAYMFEGRDPSSCLDQLDALVQALLPGQTATAVLAVVDPSTRRVELASAGHPPPVLVGPDGASLLKVPGRPLLGVGVGTGESLTFDVSPEQAVILYTDGLVEHRGVVIDESIEQLRAAAAGSPDGSLGDWLDQLLAAVPGTTEDDLTVVAFRPAH